MKVKTYKRTNKHYEDIYTKEKETKEIEIVLNNNCIIKIAEHQLGQELDKAHVDIICEDCGYSMDIDVFLEKIKL